MKTKLSIIIIATMLAWNSRAAFTANTNPASILPYATNLTTGSTLIVNAGGNTNLNLSVTNVLPLLNAVTPAPFALRSDTNSLASTGYVASAVSALSSVYQPLDADLTALATNNAIGLTNLVFQLNGTNGSTYLVTNSGAVSVYLVLTNIPPGILAQMSGSGGPVGSNAPTINTPFFVGAITNNLGNGLTNILKGNSTSNYYVMTLTAGGIVTNAMFHANGTFNLQNGALFSDTLGNVGTGNGFYTVAGATPTSGRSVQTRVGFGANLLMMYDNNAQSASSGLLVSPFASLLVSNGVLEVASYFPTAGTAVNWTSNNLYSGMVKLAAGQQSYYITNSAFGTNSLVLASVLDDDATVIFVKALNIATNLVQLKANGVAAADCRIGWKLIAK